MQGKDTFKILKPITYWCFVKKNLFVLAVSKSFSFNRIVTKGITEQFLKVLDKPERVKNSPPLNKLAENLKNTG